MNEPGLPFADGAVVNGHVLTSGLGWVRLNHHVNRALPRREGDVIDGHVWTGHGWVPLPGSWLTDPTGRHQFRWWTGTAWTHHAQTNGHRFDDYIAPMAPRMAAWMPTHRMPAREMPTFAPDPARPRIGFWRVVDRILIGLYCGFWLLVALFSVTVAAEESDPKYLALTATASMNIFLYKLTGKTRSELRRGVLAAFKSVLPYVACGAASIAGIWLSVHFDDPNILGLTAVVVLVGLLFSWVLS